MKNSKKEGGKKKSKTWTKKSNDANMFTKKELNAIVKKASNKVIKKAKKELNAVAKRKKDNLGDDRLEASINNVETLNQQMKDVDKHIQEFILRSTEIDV